MIFAAQSRLSCSYLSDLHVRLRLHAFPRGRGSLNHCAVITLHLRIGRHILVASSSTSLNASMEGCLLILATCDLSLFEYSSLSTQKTLPASQLLSCLLFREALTIQRKIPQGGLGDIPLLSTWPEAVLLKLQPASACYSCLLIGSSVV